MKLLKLILIIIIIIISIIFIKIKFFNPFEQNVSLTSSNAKANTSHSTNKRDKLILAGPFATVSHPLIHMVKTGALDDVAEQVEFKLWRNPDQLRAFIIEGNIDFIAVPTNVAANLYNKKQNIRLLNVSIWGILGMISRDENLKTLKDFKGKNILVPFRSDMPDIVLKELLKAQGFDPDKDFKLHYVSNPIDAMQMLILRRADHALLAEPAISMALRKTGSFPLKAIAPSLFRSADLQYEWATTFNTDNKIPQAGMAVLGNVDPHIIKRFNTEYKKALDWYKANPIEAGIETASVLPMLDAQAISDSIKYINLEAQSAKQAQEKLEFLFTILKRSEPKLIGGKLPDQGFYYED